MRHRPIYIFYFLHSVDLGSVSRSVVIQWYSAALGGQEVRLALSLMKWTNMPCATSIDFLPCDDTRTTDDIVALEIISTDLSNQMKFQIMNSIR